MKCEKCGGQLMDNARFCTGCGTPVQPPQNNTYQPSRQNDYQPQQNTVQANYQQTQANGYQNNYQPPQQNNYQQPPYQQNPYQNSCGYQNTYAPPYQVNIVQKLSDKVKINGIIWIIVGIIQIITGIIIAAALGSYDGGLMVNAIIILVIGIINTTLSIKDFKYSKEVLQSPVGIVKKFSPLGGPIGNLIYNILFGGIIGVAGSIYYFTVRSFVMNNSMQFTQIEEQYIVQNNR